MRSAAVTAKAQLSEDMSESSDKPEEEDESEEVSSVMDETNLEVEESDTDTSAVLSPSKKFKVVVKKSEEKAKNTEKTLESQKAILESSLILKDEPINLSVSGNKTEIVESVVGIPEFNTSEKPSFDSSVEEDSSADSKGEEEKDEGAEEEENFKDDPRASPPLELYGKRFILFLF